MQNILEIATAITNPYSLLALTYLILFLLFRGVIAKTGIQKGKSGFRIIKYLMTLVAVVSVLTLMSVFALRAYEVYRQSDLVDTLNQGIKEVKNEIRTASNPDLRVDFHVAKYTGANMLIGNQGQGIIIVSELTIHWSYRKCPRFREPTVGAPLVEYRYEVALTTSDGSQRLDSKEFKYGAGDVDKFLIGLSYPDHGVYTVWLSFQYRELGEDGVNRYETEKDEREVCVKW